MYYHYLLSRKDENSKFLLYWYKVIKTIHCSYPHNGIMLWINSFCNECNVYVINYVININLLINFVMYFSIKKKIVIKIIMLFNNNYVQT
jgi:hypothetical protein